MIGSGVGLIASGAGFKPGAIALAGGALATYAARIACTYDQGGKGPGGGGYCNIDMSGVCKELAVGTGQLRSSYPEGFMAYGDYQKVLAIGCPKYGTSAPDSNGYVAEYRDFTVILHGDEITTERITRRPQHSQLQLYTEFLTEDGEGVKGSCTENPFATPFEGFDANNCAITVQMMGMGAAPSGDVSPVLLIEPGHLVEDWEASGGPNRPNPGPISPTSGFGHQQTCSFAPVLAWPQPDGDPVYTPIDPGEDLGPALERLSKQLDSRYNQLNNSIGEIGGDLNDLNNKLDELIDQIDDPNDPEDPLNIPSGTVTFVAPCDKDDAGNPEQMVYPMLGANTRNSALTAIYHQNTVIAGMIQQHLNWKTPICRDKVKPEGDYRTISFVSDLYSPHGRNRLRKRFKYRSQSGLGLGDVVNHWKDFTWTSGPVCVIHSGSAVGTPQVWASTVDEGKRVIRHAFGEAGGDPDQIGKWTVSGSDNPRFGVSLQMRVNTKGGYYWITARDGSDQRPIVARI